LFNPTSSQTIAVLHNRKNYKANKRHYIFNNSRGL